MTGLALAPLRTGWRMLPLALIGLLLTGASPLDARSTTLTLLIESGSVYLPPAGTSAHYVTSVGPDHTYYERRNLDGSTTGEIWRAPPLLPPFPITTAPTLVTFREADGVTPFPDPSLFHPKVVETDSGIGMYVIDELPIGTVHFFHSTDDGITWVFQESIPFEVTLHGAGIIDTFPVVDPTNPGASTLRILHQNGYPGVRLSATTPGAVALDLFTDRVVIGSTFQFFDTSGITPTGNVSVLPDDSLGLLFVVQSDAYVGLARSTDGGSGWTILQGADEPVVSSAVNATFPDPLRPDIHELTLIGDGTDLVGYFTGRIPGGSPGQLGIGSIAITISSEIRRGDCNTDGNVDIADALCLLGVLFAGDPISCLDAGDANDDGSIDIGDPITILQSLFVGIGPLPSPYPDCGLDPTPDALRCQILPDTCP